MNKPFFHELPVAEYESLKASHATWKDVMDKFSQPVWCGYPEALGGPMGCWSLVGRMVTGKDYCKDCDCFMPEEKAET